MHVMDSFILNLFFFYFCFRYCIYVIVNFIETIRSLEDKFLFNFKQNTYLDIDSLVYQFPCKKARNSVAIAYIFSF